MQDVFEKAKEAVLEVEAAVGTLEETTQRVKEAVVRCKNKPNGSEELLEAVDGIKKRKQEELEMCKGIEKKARETTKKLEEQLVEVGRVVHDVVLEMLIEVKKEFREKMKKMEEEFLEKIDMLKEERDNSISNLLARVDECHCEDLQSRDIGHELLKENLKVMGVWTRKQNARVLFDSEKDEFTNAEFNTKCLNQQNIAVVGFTTDGDVFGGYLEKAVTKTRTYLKDPNHFAFSLESRGRCLTPQRWFQKDRNGNTCFCCENNKHGFIAFGNGGGFYLGNERSDSYCCDLSEFYEGIEDETLTGKNNGGSSDNNEDSSDKDPFHHCKRLIVLQFFN